MENINKQQAGFKFGKYRLKVIEEIGSTKYDGRIYKLVKVQTHENQEYYSLRLYNGTGKFIKQLLFEPEVLSDIADLFEWAEIKEDLNAPLRDKKRLKKPI